MNYNYVLTVIKNTTKAAPSTKDLRISKGRIVHAALYFPIAADDKVNVVLEYQGSQILPTNPDGYYYADLMMLDFPDSIPITEPPFMLKAKGWNSLNVDVDVVINLTIIPPGTPAQTDQLAS